VVIRATTTTGSSSICSSGFSSAMRVSPSCR
jgi:hypothetical protein